MNRSLLVAGACALAMASTAAHAAVTITVSPWLAPNAFGSPSYGAAAANAVDALYQGQTTGGVAGLPTYFEVRSDVTAAETVVTGFNSWRGKADPGTVYGPAFASESGNRMTFGVSIVGDGELFSISQMGFEAHSNDAGDALGFGFGPGEYDYVAGNYIGVLYGADGVLGGGDDTFVTGGPNTQLVNAIFGRGSGNSFPAYCPGCSIADQQAQIDGVAAYMQQANLTKFTGTYYLTDGRDGRSASGSAAFNISAVPEPGVWTLLIGGFALTGSALRRRRVLASA